MDASMQSKLEHVSPGQHVLIGTVDGSVVDAEILEVNQSKRSVSFRHLDNMVEETLSLDQIDMLDDMQDDYGMAQPETIDDQLRRIAIGKYLMLWGKFSKYTINQSCEQGKLKSINWDNRTLVLTSTVYDGREDTVDIDKISSIDESRERSGALGPAMAPDWYRGADGTWRKNGREYKG